MALGILLGRYLPAIAVLASCILLGGFAVAASFGRLRRMRAVRIPFLMCCLGALLMWLFSANVSGGLLPRLAASPQHVEVACRASSGPVFKAGQSTFYAKVAEVKTARERWRVDETVLVRAPDSPASRSLFNGRSMRLFGRVTPPLSRDSMLPHGVASILTADRVIPGGANPALAVVNSVRLSMSSSFRRAFPKEVAGLIEGVTMSRLDDMDAATENDLRSCGLSHLVSVAGLHVGSAAVLALALMSLCGAGRRSRYVCAALVALSVMCMAGFRISSVRAAIMASLAFGAALLGRDSDSFAGLSVAGLFILALNPAALFDGSFQFSFAAALVIIASMSLARRAGPLRASLCVCAAAQAGITPLVLLGGEGIPVTALAANLLAVPVVAPLLFLSWLVALATPVSVSIGKALAFIPGCLARYVMWVAAFFSRVPTVRPTGFIQVASLLLYSGGLVALILAIRRKKPLYRPAVAVLLAAALVMLGFVPMPTFRSSDSVTILDVGEGDAVLLRDSKGATVLVDGGPDEDKIIAKLQARGVSRIDLAVSTHPHADHTAGLVAVLEQLPCGRLIDADLPAGEVPERDRLLEAAAARNVPRTVSREGATIGVSSLTQLEVLYPPAEGTEEAKNINENSMVIMAKVGEARVLLTGDIEKGGQEFLLSAHPDLSCQVMKVPHQGAANGMTDGLLEAARPSLAVISVGRDNKFGHPSGQCLRLLEERGIAVMRTDTDGDVEVSVSGGRIGIAGSTEGVTVGKKESGQHRGARQPLLHLRGGGTPGGALARAPQGALLERGGPRLQHDRDDRPGVVGGGHHRGRGDRASSVQPSSRDSPGGGQAQPQRAGEARRLREG